MNTPKILSDLTSDEREQLKYPIFRNHMRHCFRRVVEHRKDGLELNTFMNNIQDDVRAQEELIRANPLISVEVEWRNEQYFLSHISQHFSARYNNRPAGQPTDEWWNTLHEWDSQIFLLICKRAIATFDSAEYASEDYKPDEGQTVSPQQASPPSIGLTQICVGIATAIVFGLLYVNNK